VNADLSVYLVTDSGPVHSVGRSVPQIVAEAIAGGVTAVQVRNKNATAREFLELVTRIESVVPPAVALLVNDRVDVFLAGRASGLRLTGVHLGQTDLPVSLVRTLVGADAVIGLSAATSDELHAAADDPAGVDYIGIGALRATRTKPDAPAALGIEGFTRLVRLTKLPAVAIGGVRPSDLPALRAAGAAGAAVVSAICGAPDPRAAARALADAWQVSIGPADLPPERSDR
jgi:thiamine-phosphate pyrophosphorylase